jgi:hypothetical protein
MGSHATYSQRVPSGFETPGLDGKGFERDYIWTICYTNYVLDAIISRLARQEGRCFLWYVSDHGEVPQKWDVAHGKTSPTAGELQIPMLIWGNRTFWASSGPAFQRMQSRAGERVCQDATFPTILGLAGITYSGMIPPATYPRQVMSPERACRFSHRMAIQGTSLRPGHRRWRQGSSTGARSERLASGMDYEDPVTDNSNRLTAGGYTGPSRSSQAMPKPRRQGNDPLCL